MLNSFSGLSDKTSMTGTNENPQTLNPKPGPNPNKKPEQSSSLKGGIGKKHPLTSLLSRELKHSMPEPPHLESSKSNTNTLTHTVNTNTTNTTNTTIIYPHHTQKQTGQVSDDTGDPFLVALEKYLLELLDAHDVVIGEDGVLLFNVNQVAYIVEEKYTNEDQNSTRRRIKEAKPPLETVPTRCAHLGKGESFILKCISNIILR
jgi:hypothetical protein